MAEKKNEIVTEIGSDFDALSKLFAANQFVAQTTRELDEAKHAAKAALLYRDTLMEHIDSYTVHRKEQRARQMTLDTGFNEEPMPPWMSNSKDLDGRDDGGAQ
jgi:hypothetical protein